MDSRNVFRVIIYGYLLSVPILLGQNTLDFDNDGLLNAIDVDDDNDLVPDVVEALWEMNPMDPADAILDIDGDGLSAQLEYATGRDPFVRDRVIQFDSQSNELKVRELVSRETTRLHLSWSQDLTNWSRALFSDASEYADSVLSSSFSESDTPLGTVREWTYQLAGDAPSFFRTEVESTRYATVFRKLHKGVNLDVSRPSSGAWFKIQYDALQMQTIAEAGFESVRIFMPYFATASETEQQIRDALDHDLAVVVCMWGRSSWASNVSLGEQQIAQKWGDLARLWKDFSGDLVFEILNEPEGIGFLGTTGNADAMRVYNAAAQAIRDEDPDRPILIGTPGHNDSEYLDPYATENHLRYTFDGGKGFYDDRNAAVAIHFYAPRHEDGLNFAMWTASLGNNASRWQDPISKHIEYAVEWRDSVGVDAPVIITEWGCWTFPTRDASGEMESWLDFHLDLFENHDIGSMWYTGIQYNQRSFGIFDSELGWHPIVTPRLTGQDIPTAWPPIDQVINGEFFSNDGWLLTSNEISAAYLTSGAFSGRRMLKLTVPELADGGQMYLQSLVSNSEAPGKFMFHLIGEQTYRISFTARSEDGDGKMKVLLKDVGNGEVIYESAETSIGSSQQTYDFFYTHNAPDEMNVRLEFDIGSQAQVLYLDRVEFIRDGPAGYSVTVNTESGSTVVDYSVGLNVEIDALPAPDGNFFDRWIFEPYAPVGVDTGSVTTSFNMPANDLTATAVYQEGNTPSFSLTVNTASGSISEEFELGEMAMVDAEPAPDGQIFDEWTFGPSSPSGADTTNPSTSFAMPSNDVTATASYRDFESVNLIANGEFDQGAGPWGLWLNGSDASYTVEAGEAVITITSAGDGIAKPQFVQPGLELIEREEYTLSFRARAESEKQVIVYFTPGTLVGEFDLTTEMQSFGTTFTTAKGSGRLDFLLGTNDADVVLDEISIVEGPGQGG